MVQVSYPGVYVQEVSSGVKTITGVATSIAAFFGRATMGPVNRAVRCLSYSDFERNFGAPHALSELAASVKLFFDNGGTDCYVVRLAHDPRAAAVTLLNLDGRRVLNAAAKMAGAWGNGVRLEVDYNTTNPGETFNLRVSHESGGRVIKTESFSGLSMDFTSPRYAPTFVTQSSELIKLDLNDDPGTGLGDITSAASFYNTNTFAGFSQSRRPLGTDLAGVLGTLQGLLGAAVPRTSFDISVNNSAYVTVNLTGFSTTVGDYADLNAVEAALQNRVNTALSSLAPAQTVVVTLDPITAAGTPLDGQQVLTITAATPATTSVRVRRAAASDISAGLMLGAENGGIELARFSDYRPVPTGTAFLINDAAGNGLARLNAITALTQNPNDLTTIRLDGVDIALALNTTAAANDGWFRDNLPGDSPSGHNDGIREKLRMIANAISDSATSRYRAEVHGYMLVILPKDGSANQRPTVVINGGAAGDATTAFGNALNVNVRQYMLGIGGQSTHVGVPVDGLDGTMPEFADYVGSINQQTGFYALDAVDLFNLMVLPADREMSDTLRQQLWGPASVYCQQRRAFLIIDAPDSWTSPQGRPLIVQNSGEVNTLRATVVKDHSAVFYPKIRINDRGTVTTLNPSGALAGLFARIDATRGVWKAPAGTEADLRNLIGLNVKLTDRENGVLNKLGANCLRVFPSGFVNWGARTMEGSDDTPSDYKYIPIRRLTLFIEESLYRGTQWVVFEPNDEPLWAKIRLNVGVFMNNLFRQGAFQGSTANEAFYVKCDKDTTTQADRNLGIVNIQVGFAPLKPAEFVVITIQQIAGDLK